MIFIAAAAVVTTTTVFVGVALATRVSELLSPLKRDCCNITSAVPQTEKEAAGDESAQGCTAHLLQLYQQA